MAGERRINWGADATDARYRTEDTGDGANFVVAEDLDGGTVLLEYDDSASEWVSRGPINMDGNAISNVSDLDVSTVNGGGPVYDGDGTERQIWVIAKGASDPDGANPEDIIFEEES